MTTRSCAPLLGSAGECDTRLLRVDHLLDHHSHCRICGEVAAGTVGDDARAEQRHPAPKHRVDEPVVAADVGDGRVHAGERGVAAVFAGCRGPHGHHNVGSEGVIRGRRSARASCRQRRPCGPGPASARTVRASRVVSADILRGLAVKRAELGVHPAGPHRIPVAVPQQDEAGRDGQLGRDQLTHVRALAAGFLGIGDAAAWRCLGCRCRFA